MRHVVVDHHGDIVDIYAARHNVGGYEDIDISGAEIEHHVITCLLFEIGVHLADAVFVAGESA